VTSSARAQDYIPWKLLLAVRLHSIGLVVLVDIYEIKNQHVEDRAAEKLDAV
jgi:hypothetical protein